MSLANKFVSIVQRLEIAVYLSTELTIGIAVLKETIVLACVHATSHAFIVNGCDENCKEGGLSDLAPCHQEPGQHRFPIAEARWRCITSTSQ
jgi:hypothetical protein